MIAVGLISDIFRRSKGTSNKSHLGFGAWVWSMGLEGLRCRV